MTRTDRFQSTPPSRAATEDWLYKLAGYDVSIHAALAGGDVARQGWAAVEYMVSIHAVSIHAALAGGDGAYKTAGYS